MLSDAIVTLTASFNGILAATQAQETIAVSLVKDDDDAERSQFRRVHPEHLGGHAEGRR
jgi:hypothetical protein